MEEHCQGRSSYFMQEHTKDGGSERANQSAIVCDYTRADSAASLCTVKNEDGIR